MATVFLAEDLRHQRRVAIKVLKPDLAAVLGGERFIQEITTTAALQHPHILPLFDSGSADSFLYYVMPYVEGETLRSKLDRERQLGIEEAVRITREVADALDYAHRHGVIHRDIKPENILMHDGRATVADFGIALAVSAAAGGRMTETGLSLGTPHYMSPEQATAEREITGRSDIYSLGCVLYEMLTGNPPHTGATAQQIIMKIVTEEAAPIARLRKSVPEHVAEAVAQAVEKLPADRFESAKAFAEALAGGAPSGLRATSRAGARAAAIASPQVVRPRVLMAALVVTAALAAWGWLRPVPEGQGPSRQRVQLWSSSLGGFLDPATERAATQLALAPDGSSLVYVDSGAGNWQLFLKRRDEARATPIPGTEGGLSPFYSPDGAWIGFVTTDGRLRKVSVRGGGVVTLASDAHLIYATAVWQDDGTIVYVGRDGQQWRVPGLGGTGAPVPGTSQPHAAVSTGLASLPGSRGYLYTHCPGNCAISSDIMLREYDADSARVLVASAVDPVYLPTGHLLYTTREGGLFAAPFDAKRLELGTGAVPLFDGVIPGSVAVSASGTLVYRIGEASGGSSELVWVSRDGTEEPAVPGWIGGFEYPAIAPDGRAIAVSLNDNATHIWIWRPDGTRQRLTRDGTLNWRPAWVPDGRSLYFVSNRDDQMNVLAERPAIWRAPADGSEPPRLVLRRQFGTWEAEPSRDGQWLVVRSDEAGDVSNVYARRLHGDTTELLVLADGANAYVVALSPDSRWLAYSSDVSGRNEVYVTSFPDRATERLMSTAGGLEPRWSRDGRELFFKDGGNLVVVSVPPGPVFTPGPARILFSTRPYRLARNRQQYDVAPDGRRFLMIRPLRERGADEIVLVENWFDELRERIRR